MNVKAFLKLVEIQTKIASVFPFLIGVLFTLHRYDNFKLLNTVVFFFAMIIFDMTTTAINNFLDYKKAVDEDYKITSNVIGRLGLNEKTILILILAMLSTAIGLGLYLVYLTSIIVLLFGVLCFGIGIFYTFGPIPLSRLPLGEVFSGITMGFGILFLTVYVNTFDLNYLAIAFVDNTLSMSFYVPELITIIFVSIPSIFTIANLMLANNICDLEEDVKNHRYTIVYFLGQAHSLKLFNTLYILAFLSILLLIFTGVHHPAMLLTLLAVPLVYKGVQQFNLKQIKSETFVIAVKNLVLVDGIIVIGLISSLLLG